MNVIEFGSKKPVSPLSQTVPKFWGELANIPDVNPLTFRKSVRRSAILPVVPITQTCPDFTER